MKTIIKYLPIILLCASLVQAMRPVSDNETITLISNNQGFVVPKKTALESGTIAALLEGNPQEEISFKLLSPIQLQEIAGFMWSLYRHNDLQGKPLLDAIEGEMSNRISNLTGFLKAADFLDLKPAIAYVASSAPKAKIQELILENIDKRSGWVNQVAQELARYYFLIKDEKITIQDRDLPENFNFESYYGFSIQDYLEYQPKKINERRQDKTLDLSQLQLNSLEGLQRVSNLSTIEFLQLDINQLQTIPAQAFAELTNLKWLNLTKNQLQTIPAFAGLTNLEWLVLDDNQLQTIPTQAFAELHNLKGLFLKGNKLQTIPAQAFAGLHNLQKLYLGHNQLQTISAQAFAGLHDLRVLLLDNNKLQTILAQAFAGLTNLQFLDLNKNQLSPENISAIRAQLPPGVHIQTRD